MMRSVKKVGYFLALLNMLLLLWFATSFDRADEYITIDGMDVAVWLPEEAKGPLPVVIFSHGLFGCNTSLAYFTRALSRAGYAVFSPNHRDRACGVLQVLPPQKDLARPDTWDASTYADRIADIRLLLDKLPAIPRYASPRLDWNTVGVAGTSLGGYTALGLAGAWQEARDERIQASLAMVPYSAPYLKAGTLHKVHIPVMLQAGTRDMIVVPNPQHEVFTQLAGKAWHVELEGAQHSTWFSDAPEPANPLQERINAYGIAYFDTVLKRKPFPEVLARDALAHRFEYK